MTTTRINTFVAKADKIHALKEFLTGLRPYIRKSDGCISCELFQQEGAKSVFYIIEKWQSKEQHQASVAGYPKQDMAAVMDMLADAPQGNYYLNCE